VVKRKIPSPRRESNPRTPKRSTSKLQARFPLPRCNPTLIMTQYFKFTFQRLRLLSLKRLFQTDKIFIHEKRCWKATLAMYLNLFQYI